MKPLTPGRFKGLINELKSELMWADWAKNERKYDDNEEFLAMAKKTEDRINKFYTELYNNWSEMYDESQTIKTDQERK